ncbi:Steroid 5 alpha-reductase 3, partial [Dispira simplex]
MTTDVFPTGDYQTLDDLFQNLCILGVLLRAYYIAITISALVLVWWPPSQDLVKHGKTQRRVTWSSRDWWRFQDWLVPKRWFAHFYLVGALWNGILLYFFFRLGTVYSLEGLRTAAKSMMDRPELSYQPEGVASTGHTLMSSYLYITITPVAVPVLPGWLRGVFTAVRSWIPRSYWASPLISGSATFSLTATPAYLVLTLPVLSLVALALFQFHLIRRALECYIVQRPSDSRMHVGHYLVGLSYYLVTCLALVWDTFGIWFIPSADHEPAFIKLVFLSNQSPVSLRSTWYLIMAGIALSAFIFTSFQQTSCHTILARLRAPPEGSPPDKQAVTKAVYRIPQGHWFEMVECPHYLAEVLLYIFLTALPTLWLISPNAPTLSDLPVVTGTKLALHYLVPSPGL